jgi:hypothetical protein
MIDHLALKRMKMKMRNQRFLLAFSTEKKLQSLDRAELGMAA